MNEEALYVKAYLLVLNICTFILRHIIDHHCNQQSLRLCDFLENKKHNLFHLFAKRCCCSHQSNGSRSSPMNRSQWELLFTKTTSSCQNGQKINCPCQYNAKQGIKTEAMDVTLSCLIINNLCPGVDLDHVHTIRDVRNKLVHAQNAKLDQAQFMCCWNSVETAILDLASHVSSELHSDTRQRINELKNRVMDSEELGELRKLIVDDKRFSDLEKNVTEIKDELTRTTEETANTVMKVTTIEDNTTRDVSNLENSLKQLREEVTNIAQKVSQIENNSNRDVPNLEHSLKQLREELTKAAEKIFQIENNSTRDVSNLEHSLKQLREELTKAAEKIFQIENNSTRDVSNLELSLKQLREDLTKTAEKVTQIENNAKKDVNCFSQTRPEWSQTRSKRSLQECHRYQRKIARKESDFEMQRKECEEHKDHPSPFKQTSKEHDQHMDNLRRQHYLADNDRLTDDHGRHGRHGRHIDDHGREIDDHGREIGDHGREIDDHGREIDNHLKDLHYCGRHKDYHERQTHDHGRRIDDHGRRIDDHGRRIDDHARRIDDHAKWVADICGPVDRNVRRFDEDRVEDYRGNLYDYKSQREDLRHKIPTRIDNDSDIKKLRARLMDINHQMSQVITLSPLEERNDDKLPIELLFSSVVIREDLTYSTKGKDSSQHIGKSFRSMEQITEHNLDFGMERLYHEEKPHTRKVINPDDIFLKDGKDVKDIFMLGDAAHGKTVFCKWLLRTWCNAKKKNGIRHKEYTKLEKELLNFDFVFMIQFRNVDDPNLVSVVDMICQDAFESDVGLHDAIRHVLTSDEARSLIILDGLDEWYSTLRRRMPKMDVSGSVTSLLSMRPWVFPFLKHKMSRARVLEITGLDENGMGNVIGNILVNQYRLEKHSAKIVKIKDKIHKALEQKSLQSFMKIPLLAVVCVQIWYEGKQLGDSMTSFYAAMLNMLIERANEKRELRFKPNETADYVLPAILSTHENIESYFSALLKLGKVAYEGLLSNETSLVFQKRKLEKQVGVRELQFALDVGLISQREAPSLLTKNVSVHFFHKSVQEFLAAFHAVTNKGVIDPFCKYLSNIKVIFDLSNMIMFVCGMSPFLGSVISQRVESVTDIDTEICQYRESLLGKSDRVNELYKLQIKWYREIQSGITDIPLTFHVSDVYLSEFSDIETVRVTRKLLSDCYVNMTSLWLHNVLSDGEQGITNSDLNDFLANNHNNTRSLLKIVISGIGTERAIDKIFIPSLEYLHLRFVKPLLGVDVCPPLLKNMKSLREIWLDSVTIGEGGLGLHRDMMHIRTIILTSVKMPATGWRQFVFCVSDLHHSFIAELCDTNIDDESKSGIRASPAIHITRDGVSNVTGLYELKFKNIRPLSY